MNTHSEHDRQIAAKLKSLSLQPVELEAPPVRSRGNIRFLGGVLMTISVVTGGYLLRPDSFRHPLQNAADLPVNLKADLNEAAAAVAQTKDVAGSGHVVAPVSAVLFARQTARVSAVHADIGDLVEAGQVLIQLEDEGTRLAVEAAGNGVATAETVLAKAGFDLEQAEIVARRAIILSGNQVVARSALDDALAARERARYGVAAARHALKAAQVAQAKAQSALRDLDVTAPFSGVVTEKQVQAGEMALSLLDSGDRSSSLMTITDTAQLVIDIDIAESSLASLHPGMSGEAILDGYPDQHFAVIVQRLAPVASAERGTVGVRLSLQSPPAGTRPNLAARVSLAGHSVTEQQMSQKGKTP